VYHPCAESHLYHYLNRDDVKTALHVEMGKDWAMCSDDIEYSDDDKNKPQIYLYKELIKRAKVQGSNLKMMIFSGDDDSSKS
jgi:phosphopantetheinyl transferase (holo-ACP synthase)